ncbi:MAG: threonine dehydratase [Nocardioides sp.]
MTEHGDDLAARRTQQAEVYGAPFDELVGELTARLGISAEEVARTIGVSLPMFGQLVAAQRVRIGNPAAGARLGELREFAGHLATGAARHDDIPLALAQIRSSAGVAVPSDPTVARGPGSARVEVGPTEAAEVPRQIGSTPPAPPGPELAPPAAPAAPGVPAGTGWLLSTEGLALARQIVGRHVPPTPARRWPLLERVTGTETWVKHENHNPTGAFKIRGGLTFVAELLVQQPGARGLVSATRGNHGQSLALAGALAGLAVVIVVPEGNSPDKNAAMAGFGAELVVHGRDYQEASEHAATLAAERGLVPVPAFHPWLVAGVATYAAELHEAVPGLDAVYVPVGMGTGLSANLVVRDLLGLSTEIVGVVSERAPAYALSVAAGHPVPTPDADTFVDGVACRTPDPAAVEVMSSAGARVIQVSEDDAASAMALMYRATHNLAEPAGSLALAGLLTERDRQAGRRVAVVHTGGNADFDVLARVMKEQAR